MWTPRSNCSFCFATLVTLASVIASADEPAPIRPQAVVNLTFDEQSGPILDSATTGQLADQVQSFNDPDRVPSPFWNQSGKRALQFDATQSQYLELADSADLDRPNAVTLSLLCVNLIEPSDAGFHGLVAKRGQGDDRFSTNYGINFQMQADNGQVYIHDGGGFRAAVYSAKEMLPYRKLFHLATVFEVGDAPGNDPDTDADDLRIQVFVNGAALKPKTVNEGFADGTNAWITNVNIANLVNNIPVSIGRSDASGEFFSGVVDEFSLFPQALTADQIKQLLREITGSNIEELIQQDQPVAAAVPEITRITPPGLRIGQTTQINIVGKNLLPAPRLTVPVSGATVEIVGDSTAERLTAKVTIPADAVPEIIPVYAQTENGLSAAELVSVDRLPLRSVQSVSAQEPAELPGAYWGNLQGGNVVRLDFVGKAGQRFIADVELQRLGGKSQPVLELKSAQGTPLLIAWGQRWLGGDARIETTLPADGAYAVELHDLVYRAQGGNSFRLKVGDLQFLDLPYPVAAAAGPLTVEPVGTGFSKEIRWSALFAPKKHSSVTPLPLPADVQITGPRPVVHISDAVSEVLEATPANNELQSVAATFASGPRRPVGINGRLRAKHERDRYLLQVTPGQKLRFTLQTRSIGAPIDGEIAVLAHPAGNPLAMTGDQPSDADPRLDFTVPANVTQIQVAVRDLLDRGDERSVYRLEIAPAEYPSFDLTVNAGKVSLPADGSAIIEVSLNRTGYEGPVALEIAGDEGLKIAPAVIRAGTRGKVMCRLSRTAPPQGAALSLVQIEGKSVGVDPPVTRTAVLSGSATSASFRDTLAAGAVAPGGLSIEILKPPSKMFRGVTQQVPVKIQRTANLPGAISPVRFTSQSTEPSRPRQPLNPNAGRFPVVAVPPAQIAPGDAVEFNVPIKTPIESVEKSLQLMLTAEAVVHAYSERVVATAHAVPFEATIENAVAPKVDDASLKAVSEASHCVTGELKRTAGFTGPVEVTLVGLPKEYQVTPSVVSGDQNAFSIVIKSPKVESEQALPNIKLRVTSQGSLLITEPAIALKMVPKS